ncbi:hypothetical protein C8R44DRAFT_880127 [Mycena epipterygia]|nr:hypothetical protein C8R44DRAFT_880127 [Mycena epipterygia]
MPANQTPDFKVLPGIRDMFPEHFPPRRPQPPTEPRRAPQAPDPDNNYFFGVLKHNPRNASLDVFKHNHPLPDPKRWYSQPADASFPSPTLAEHVKGTADVGTPKQVDGENMNDTQPRERTLPVSTLPLRSRRESRSLSRLLSIDAVSPPSPTAVPSLHLLADEAVSPLWRVAGGAAASFAWLPSPRYDVEGQLCADGVLPPGFFAQAQSR